MSNKGFHELNYVYTCLMGAVRPDGYSVDVYRNRSFTESVMDLDSGAVISNADKKITTLEFHGVPHPVISNSVPIFQVDELMRRMGWSKSQFDLMYKSRIGIDNATHRRSIHCAPMLVFQDYTEIRENETERYRELAYSNLMIQCWPKAYLLCGQRPPEYLSTCYAQRFHEDVLRRGLYPKYPRDLVSWLQSLSMISEESAPMRVEWRDQGHRGHRGQEAHFKFRDGSALTAHVEMYKDSVRLHTMNIEQDHRSAAYHYERGHRSGKSFDQEQIYLSPLRQGKSAFLEGDWYTDDFKAKF